MWFKTSTLLVIMLIFGSACDVSISDKAQTPTKAKKAITIVVLGSSTAAGWGVSTPDSAWVNMYRAHLKSIDSSTQVINLALGGYTTYHLLPDTDTPPLGKPQPDSLRNISAALQHNPDAVIINLPSNDTSKDSPIDEQLENFRQLHKALADKGVSVWITSTQPRNYTEDKRLLQVQMKDSLAQIFGEYYINFWDGISSKDFSILKKYDSGDGVHLNNKGHEILTKRVLEKKITLPVF